MAEEITIVGVADSKAQPELKAKPEVKVGMKEDLDDMKRRIRDAVSKTIVVGLNTPIADALAEVMKKTGVIDDKLTSYASVQIFNNLYKEQYNRVPKEERVVFIPHCLRDAKNCIAKVDEDGYHCAKCGKCSIAKITEMCEQHGMKWYMCGGGSQVLNIIQRTRPKAILGIACYNEIQMAYDKLKGRAPLQAVLLRKSGCVNTELDLNELAEALES